MAPSVKISRKRAEALLEVVNRLEDIDGGLGVGHRLAQDELRAALAPRPKKAFVTAPTRKAVKRAKKKTKKEETAEIRELVFLRAGDRCEMCKANRATDLHHAFGRVRERQSAENCLALCRPCHRCVTNNIPCASDVYRAQAAVFADLGFRATANKLLALAHKHEAKAGLSAGAANG